MTTPDDPRQDPPTGPIATPGEVPAAHQPGETPGETPGDAAVTPPATDDRGKPERPAARAPHKQTRLSSTWVAVVVAVVLLIFLLVFILQNLDSATVHFLGFSGTLPLGVAMLFSAIAGALLVALVGSARMLQLRRQAGKQRS